MASRSLPAWAPEYLLRDSWTEKVFLDLLCGRNPEVAANSRKEALDWARERHSMAERVEEAVVEGILKVRRVLRDDAVTRLAKMDESLAKELREEATPYLVYGKAFFVSPRAAIEWATGTPGRFPLFPFSLADLDAATAQPLATRNSDFTWQDVKIAFTSDHRIQVSVRGRVSSENYEGMGFGDRRNGSPDRAWEMFRELAESGGILKVPASGSALAARQKGVQKIRRILKNHFGVSSNPLPFIKGTRHYQALFKIGRSPSFET